MRHNAARGSMSPLVVLLILVKAPAPAWADLVAWDGNNIEVIESIQFAGGDIWEYTYTINSSEPSNIWHWFSYTSFPTFDVSVVNFPNADTGIDLDDATEEYDARNIDPTLTHATSTWYEPFGGPNGLGFGDTATLVMHANVFDSSPKLYGYETAASGNAGGGTGPGGSQGQVHGIGYTVIPAPSVLPLLALGGLLLVARRRR